MFTLLRHQRYGALLATMLSLSGCADNPLRLKQGYAQLSDGSVVPANIYSQTDAGLGHTQICLAQGKDENGALIFGSCATTVGKTLGAVNTTMTAVNTAASAAWSVSAVKNAFNPVMGSSGSGSPSISVMQVGVGGGTSVPVRPNVGGGAVNSVQTGPIVGSGVSINQGMGGLGLGSGW